MPADPRRVKELFVAAVELTDSQARQAFLDRECGEDLDLRRRLDVLLHAHDHPESALERPLAGENRTVDHAPKDLVGAVIAGRYKLLEAIGEGGMGEVWVADQLEPIRRRVALKVIKPGMDSRSVLARFEAERQALALMDHLNIAKVLDAGTTDDGRPFFVMELVKGVPITTFCDTHQLSPRERLELFVPVCQAIQHAHHKGIIHRDIKPSNVLVALHDEKPVPKVIDFGIAKAVGQQLTEKTVYTGFGALVGTPAYMAPEQATFNQLDIDTRADVYALGVLLYELLAGSPPFEPERFKKSALDEVLRLVREEEPQRPSARLSTSEAKATIAAVRRSDPEKLTKLVRGELDWIVMKALEKDRSRRYDTANGLARDVERYLADELVEARPPTAGYRLRKFVRKHRVVLATAAAFAGLLIAAAGISAMLAVKAMRAEAVADEKRIEAEENAEEAKQNAEWAERNAGAWNKTSQQLQEVIVKGHIRILGLQVDLDLAEVRTDPRIGLLRLAHPLKDTFERTEYGPNYQSESHARINRDYPPLLELREFVTAAVLATGQDYAPLLPPITHDGQAVGFASLSADKKTLLTLGKDYTARLWNTRTARPIAVLRKGTERVVSCGFSPDGRTVFTDDQSSVARFWDAPSGRFRAATEPRPNRYAVSEKWLSSGGPGNVSQISEGRLLTRRFVGSDWEGPVELWDTATGRLVARLDAPGCNLLRFQFLNGGRWITTLEGNSTVLVFSAEDGRLTRLNLPAGEVVDGWDISPTGRHIATITRRAGDFVSLRVWDTETWRAGPVTTPLKSPELPCLRFWTDDASGGSGMVLALGDDNGWTVNGWTVYRYGQQEPIAELSGASVWPDLLARAGDLAHGGNGWVFDTRTWQRLLPPPGRKFHPDLARFAPDGRFVGVAINSEKILIDARTDKPLPAHGDWGNLPGFGMIGARTSDSGVTIRLIPSASRLDLPADLLELWAQVAVRGEIGKDGQFIKWDEPTWERKRRELAARPKPRADLPFPGHVATDRLHWLRSEFAPAEQKHREALARELLRRAEGHGDKAEATRWKAWLAANTPKVGPAPPVGK